MGCHSNTTLYTFQNRVTLGMDDIHMNRLSKEGKHVGIDKNLLIEKRNIVCFVINIPLLDVSVGFAIGLFAAQFKKLNRGVTTTAEK